MKIDFKQIQSLASQIPDIISKGQQAVEVINSIADMVSTRNKVNESPDDNHLIESIDEEEIEVENQEKTSSGNIDLENFALTLNNPVAVATTIKEMVQQANETIQFCEEQETIRTEIRAKASVEISKINAMADLVRNYLKRSFDERAGLFDNYFNVLDTAIRNGDTALMSATLSNINSLAAQSPFKDLSDIVTVQQQLGSSDTEWDI